MIIRFQSNSEDEVFAQKNSRVRKFFKDLKKRSPVVVESYGAGGIRALEAALALKYVTYPAQKYIDSIFASSGGGIGILPVACGYTPTEVIERFEKTKLQDIVDVYSHVDFLKTLASSIRDSRSFAINSGNKLRTELRNYILGEKSRSTQLQSLENPDSFERMNPPIDLHMLATPHDRDHQGDAFVFSKRHTPNVSMSHALMASCAQFFMFREQHVRFGSGHGAPSRSFIDAAQVEPFPVVSVVKEYVSRGFSPSDVTIIGTIPIYNFQPPHHSQSLRKHFIHYQIDSVRTLVTWQLRCAVAMGARVILLQPNIDRMTRGIPTAKSIQQKTYASINIEYFRHFFPRFHAVLQGFLEAAIDAYYENPEEKLIAVEFNKSGRAPVVKTSNNYHF